MDYSRVSTPRGAGMLNCKMPGKLPRAPHLMRLRDIELHHAGVAGQPIRSCVTVHSVVSLPMLRNSAVTMESLLRKASLGPS